MDDRSGKGSFLVLAALFLVVIGAVAWRLWSSSTPDEQDEVVIGAEDEPERVVASAELFSADTATPVVGTEVVRDTLWIRVQAAGTVRAVREETLTARLSGALLSLNVREGDAVRRGQVLALIDTVETAMELASVRLRLLEARADYEAVMRAASGEDSPEVREGRARFAAARVGLDQREADLAGVELKMSRGVVRAPFAGKIARLEVAEGEWVAEGTEMMTVLDISSLEVDVEVPEGELPKLAEGRRAQVHLVAFPGESFEARVSAVNPVISAADRTGRVILTLPNPSLRVLPGMYARVLLDVEALPDRLIVPRAALLQRAETLDRHVVFVYLPEGEFGYSDWRYVNPGRESNTHVELVREGPENGIVRPGEIVLVDGHHYLSHQTKVRLVDNVAAAGGRPTR